MKSVLICLLAFLMLLGTAALAEDEVVMTELPAGEYTEDMGLPKDYIPDDPYPFAVYNASRDVKKIAITMDDCYRLDCVQDAFDIMEEYGCAMTFYPLGGNMRDAYFTSRGNKEAWQQLWRSIAGSASEIGTHTHWHSYNITKKPYSAIILYIRYPQQLLDELLGFHYPIQTVRTPYGYYNNTNYRTASVDAGYQHVILWDVSPAEKYLNYNADKIMDVVDNGSILLFHSNPKDVDCIREIVPRLLEEGYELVSVTDLLGIVKYPAGSENLYVWRESDYY